MVNLPALSNRKQAILLLTLGFLFFTLLATMIVVQKIGEIRELRKKAAGEAYDSVLELYAVGKESTSFNVRPKDTFEVNLKLVPSRPLSAVDVVLDFNHELLNLLDIIPNTAGNFKSFAPRTVDGTLFDKDTVITRANTGGETEGVIQFGAVTFDYTSEQTTNPQGLPLDPLLTLSFQVKETATGEAKIEFGARGFVALGNTTDSNAVKYVTPGSDETVVDILAQPTAQILARISLGVTLPASLLPEAISASATQVAIQVKITKVGETTPAFDQAVTFTRTNGTFASTSEISFDGTPGTYTVRVKGPLHLSQTTEKQLFADTDNTVDFSKGGTVAMRGGDLSGDDKVWDEDVWPMLNAYGKTEAAACTAADITMDGAVSGDDVNIFIKNFGLSGEE